MTNTINSASHCEYYHAQIDHPENPNQVGKPYEANCEDIIKALGLTFDEGCEFKSIWRRGRARLGYVKAESTALRDAAKAVHYAGRTLRTEEQKVAAASEPQRPSWATHTLIGFDGERQFVRSDSKGNFLAYTQESAVASHIYTPNNFDMSTLVSLGCPAVVVSPGIDATCEAGAAFVSLYDWRKIPDDHKFCAMDRSGEIHSYEVEPYADERRLAWGYWDPKRISGKFKRIEDMSLHGIDWLKSLEARPV